MAQKVVPKFITLRSNSNHKYLCLYNRKILLQEAKDSFRHARDMQFELVKSIREEEEGLFHIRSLGNNMFWETRRDMFSTIITATTGRPEDNLSNPNCTLFRLVFSDDPDNGLIRLRHEYSKYYVTTKYDRSREPCLKLDSDATGNVVEQTFELSDATGKFDRGITDSFVKVPVFVDKGVQLPTFIILQSNSNHKYLRLDKANGSQANVLLYDEDYSYGLDTRFEVVRSTKAEGLVHIRSLSNNKFWENTGLATTKWITATAEKTEENQHSKKCTLFQPIFLDPNNNSLIRLRHVSTRAYVSADDDDNSKNAFLMLKSSGKEHTDEKMMDAIKVIDWQRYQENKIIWKADMMPSRLPTSIILQSNDNHKYLHLDKANPNKANALRFDGDYSYGLETRFEVVHSTEAEGLVHIRSSRNNKFWENKGISDSFYVTATAEKVEEDPSNPRCTLFQPIFSATDDNRVIRLRHVHSKYYVVASYDKPMYGCLKLKYVAVGDEDAVDVFKVFDRQSIVVLPDRIRIKGDNGNYLKALDNGYMDYNSGVSNSQDFEFDVSASRDGGIRLKSVLYNKYWTLDKDSWILANNTSPTDHASNTVFIAMQLGENIVALRSLSTGEFCKRFSGGGKENTLRCSLTDIEIYRPMVIEEPVLSRTIDNIEYHLNDARIYDEHDVALTKEEAVNRKPKADDTSKHSLVQTVTNKSEWNASVSVGVSIKVHVGGGIPEVFDAGVETSLEASGAYEWGKSEETTVQVGSEYTVTVPAKSRVKTSLWATQASCDIPFSYTQRDVLENGSIKVYRKNDGLYKGQNAYNYRYESLQLTLDGSDPKDKTDDPEKGLEQDGKRRRTVT